MPDDYTQTQKSFTVGAIEVRHINPSIMEGERGLSSIYGQGSALPIVRYAPTFIVQPSIAGSFKIPSVITCTPGVIDASPQAVLTYQWKADGVEIDGETNAVIITVLEFDAVELTCEVSAVNFLGVDTGESNGITAERIEPIVVGEQDYALITGMSQYAQQNIMNIRHYPITGMPTINHLTNFELKSNVITGLGVVDHQTNQNLNALIVTGLNVENQLLAFSNEMYAITNPTTGTERVMTVLNPGAESGIANWTSTQGTMQAGAPATPFAGTAFFYGGINEIYTTSFQEIDIPSDTETSVDTGNNSIICRWKQSSYEGYDRVQVRVGFFDASNGALGTVLVGANRRATEGEWDSRDSGFGTIPALTRKVRIYLNFNRDMWPNNDGYIDDISLSMYGITVP